MQAHEVGSIDAVYLDCCLSDYFQGADCYEILAVPVWHEITWREAYEQCKLEFHSASGYFDNVAGSGGMAEEAIHALFATLLAEDTDTVADFAKYIEPDTDDSESVYLYIGLNAVEWDENE